MRRHPGIGAARAAARIGAAQPAARFRTARAAARSGAARAAALRWLRVGLLATLTAGCHGEAQRDERPLVVVSVPPQRFVVDRLAGERVRVVVMVPSGASPTTHAPSLDQRRALEEAALYVKVGHPSFPFEQAWLGPLLADEPDLQVVDGFAGVPQREGDPHVWLDPRNVEQLAVRLEAALGTLLPEAREELAARLAAFRRELRSLDGALRERLAQRRTDRFLVVHPAWGYFADAYGLKQVAIERDHKEPDVHELAQLIERSRTEGFRTVFVQPQIDRSSADLIAREIGARVVSLDPLAYEWDENLRRAARVLAEEHHE